jgi:hypothetical protein
MGARNRFSVFAEFILKEFPEARSIADVGGGRGLLSAELLIAGCIPTVVDPRPVGKLPHKVRRKFRKLALRCGRLPGLARCRIRAEALMPWDYDLIVGLHPDSATEPVVRLAVAARKPFAVVPCCVMPLDGRGRSFKEWVEYLRSLAPGCHLAKLGMTGANIVLFWHPRLPEDSNINTQSESLNDKVI